MSTATEVDRIDIRDVARRLGLKVRERGAKAFIYCPACERDADTTKPPHHCELAADKPVWHCHRCGESGDAVGLVRAVLHCEAGRAFQWLRDRSFLPDSDREGGLSGENVGKYDPLRELTDRRDWEREALEALGAEGDGRIVRIPMRDADGNIVGWKSRKANNSPFALRDGSEVKSLTGRGEHNGLFYPEGLADAPDPVLVCEGEADTVAALSAGWPAVVGTAGAAVGKDCARDLARLLAGRAVVLCPDPDDAGRKWRDAQGRVLANVRSGVKFVSPNGDRDLDDRLRAGADLTEVVEGALEWEDSEDAASQFFEKNTFIPLRLARWLKVRHELVFGFDPENGAGRLMEYVGGAWRPAVGLNVEGKQALGECANSGRLAEAERLLALDVPRVSWNDWNPHRRLINCRSGMLDPLTLELRPHRPEDYSTFQVPAEFNPDAESPVVERFLADVLPADCLEVACMMMGYLLIPDLSADKLFVLEGPAGTGKTTFLDALLRMIGPRNWTQVTLQDLAENRFASARLENKLVGCFDDLDSTSMKTVSHVKALTGGHPWLTVERKCKDAYKAPLYARLVFSCNEMPRARDKSQAWLDRVFLLPFTNRFRDTSGEDRQMPDKLSTTEAQQVLFALAVSGLKMLAEEHDWRFPEPESVGLELKDYHIRNDSVAAFVEECCIVSPHGKARRGLWYDAYRAWAEASGLHPVSKRNAYRRLRDDYGCEDHQTHDGGRFFVGIGLERRR